MGLRFFRFRNHTESRPQLVVDLWMSSIDCGIGIIDLGIGRKVSGVDNRQAQQNPESELHVIDSSIFVTKPERPKCPFPAGLSTPSMEEVACDSVQVSVIARALRARFQWKKGHLEFNWRFPRQVFESQLVRTLIQAKDKNERWRMDAQGEAT